MDLPGDQSSIAESGNNVVAIFYTGCWGITENITLSFLVKKDCKGFKDYTSIDTYRQLTGKESPDEIRKELALQSKTWSVDKRLSYLFKAPDTLVSDAILLAGLTAKDFGVKRASAMRLRKKIEKNPRKPVYIVTVPGHGYKFAGQ